MSKRQLEPFAAEVLEVGATAVGLNSDKFLLGDCLIDGALEIWTSAIVPRYWTPTIAGTSSVNREGTTTRGGTYGLKLSIDGSESLASIEQAIRMSPGGYYTLDVCYRNSAGAKTSNQRAGVARDLEFPDHVWARLRNVWRLPGSLERDFALSREF